jgi:hypothetical protein
MKSNKQRREGGEREHGHFVSCLAPKQKKAQRRSEVLAHQLHGELRAGFKLTFFVAAAKYDFIAAERGSLVCRPI